MLACYTIMHTVYQISMYNQNQSDMYIKHTILITSIQPYVDNEFHLCNVTAHYITATVASRDYLDLQHYNI